MEELLVCWLVSPTLSAREGREGGQIEGERGGSGASDEHGASGDVVLVMNMVLVVMWC